jgi:membrane-bound lytic murein transglycosylase MltF
VRRLCVLLVTMLAVVVTASAQQTPAKPSQAKPLPPRPAAPRSMPTDTALKPWKGDFDGMIERRYVRVLAPYSRTFFFNELGRERGYAADLVRVVEGYLNTTLAAQLGKRPLTFILIPTTRDKLLTGVTEGIGDIAVNVAVSDERKQQVDFIVPSDAPPMAEVVLTGPKSPVIATVDDLSGKTVHARPSSLYYQDVVALSEKFKKAGKAPVNLVSVPDALEDEDMMEMLNLGLLEVILVDDLVANMWAKILPKITVHNDLVLRKGTVGWAVRKNSPSLQQAVMEAYVTAIQRTPKTLSDRLARYSGRVKQLQDPTGSADYARYEQTFSLFQKYGARYAFDPLMLAAQGFQESRLSQDARSPVGAIGIMQLMPATGKELQVGDILVADPNVHAGTKYMDQLVAKEYPGAAFDEVNRSLFAFAAYNCGPGNMTKIREAAAARGLNPNVWFNNVEIVTAEKIGIETTTYVRNIYKYYVSYKLLEDAKTAAKAAREAIKK